MPSVRALVRVSLLLGLAALVVGCQTIAPPQPPAPTPAAPVEPAPIAPVEPPAPPAPPPPPAPPRELHIGLALGGGAARGFAHVGVIKALEARGIHPDIVVGTSVGSFVGALYAAGYGGNELQRVALQFEESIVTDWSLPARGLFKGQSLQDFVNRQIGYRPMEKLPRKLAVVATDLGTGAMMVFERGNVGMAVRASSSVPGVFQPVAIGGHEYVDGGLVSPVPVSTARRLGADVVIAVDVSKLPVNQSTVGAFDILLQTFTIMGQVIARSELAGADIVLRPQLGSLSGTDFAARESSIAEGEHAVAAQAERIDAALNRARQNLTVTASPPSNP